MSFPSNSSVEGMSPSQDSPASLGLRLGKANPALLSFGMGIRDKSSFAQPGKWKKNHPETLGVETDPKILGMGTVTSWSPASSQEKGWNEVGNIWMI